MKYFFTISLALLFLGCGQEQKTTTTTTKSEEKVDKTQNLFELVPGAESGITFSNTLKEDVGTIENLFDFDYFYNGAGVGVADINNDGLQDLFFAGNQVENKLYLNKGNLQFEDISEQAGINTGKQWANGVTFADVNNDGWIDIYVSQGGPKQAEDRKNLLYINLKDNRFRESAQDYNLADTGISTQSVFFDYDNDGDLDCVVSNENEFYGLDPQRFFATMKLGNNLEKSSVQLYENKGTSYRKVTKEAGLLKAAFGLGITVSDINNDGWLDIYITNDYYVPDAMYINNKNGTFSDRIKEYTKQVSFFGMGVDIADINNDKLQDIFVLDMAASDHVRSKTLMASMDVDRFSMLVDDFGFQHQYMFNSLQLNMGGNHFNNAVHQAKMAKTDWSWAGLIADLDNDSHRDVYVTNGYRRYALDNDIQNQVRDTQKAFGGKVPLDVKQKLYDAMPTEKLSNIMFHNDGNLHFENKGYQWGLAVASYSNGGAYADLDNDGDLELVVNNIDDEAFLFKNTSVEKETGNYARVSLKGKTSETFAKVTIAYGDQSQVYESKRTKGYLSATENSAHFGLGDVAVIDKVTVQWLSGKSEERTNIKANTTLVFSEEEATISTAPIFKVDDTIEYAFAKAETTYGLDFIHKENTYDDFAKEVLLPYKQSTLGPHMTKGDVNGDGLDDIYVGGASGQAGQLYIQTASGFSKSKQLAFTADAIHEDMESILFDADGDQDLDLIVVSGGNEFNANALQYKNRYYQNDGKGTFTQISFDEDTTTGFLSGKSITTIDYDSDGDFDIIVGNRIEPQHFPTSAPSQVYQNNGGSFTNVTAQVAPELANFGIVNKVIATDYDSDGDADFMVVGEWSHIGVFKNNDGVFTDVSKEIGLDKEKGWWFTITETDVNKDGFPDYIVGNIGDNIKYKASAKTPFKVFASDFDDNGTFDLVLSNNYNGNYVPARGKECSTQQMPFISEKFETYNAFANATLKDIYGEKLETAYQKEVTTFSSKLLLNKGDGSFVISELPSIAQAAPVLSVISRDINNDGFEDAIVIGNIYETEVETPRYDAGNGVVLLSNQKDGYTALSAIASGLYVEGNAKALLEVSHKALDKEIVVIGVNDSPLKILTFK
ncbi:VCBS repeat-containing protein [uncultured Dokdonia sp.]|uniref:VCBS repeat-containing protein n=1 Tax=uncultured Dokdonia sp. TaxID=575653 RepID=UPI00262251C5|nr:VCBS repeat-containing protein [uncultured Dokdonia sp.]